MIKIICIGKLKENYLKDAEQEYLKRLKKYTQIELIELPDSNIDDEKIKKVLSLYKDVDANNKDEYNEKLKKMFCNLDKGFLYKETIYKVK